MAQFTLERVIRALPEKVFDVSLDPELHVRSMASHAETMLRSPDGGVFSEGSTVTWRARHFGIFFRLTSVVYAIERPHRFCDSQIAGPFAAFAHEHEFEPHPDGTLMRDTITFRSPFGILGTIVDRLFMTRYLKRLIGERNDTVTAEAESLA